MRHTKLQTRCKRDLKRMKRRGKNHDLFLSVAKILAERGSLPASYRPHKLTGEWKGLWECHIEPNWLLIYDVTDSEIFLVRTGSHSDLFE